MEAAQSEISKPSRGPFGKGPIPGSQAGFWIHDGDGYPIARVFVEGSCSTGNANADLFAAAADTLDFAKRFEAAAGVLIAGLPTNHAVAKDLIGLRDVARGVIAKAEGRTH